MKKRVSLLFFVVAIPVSLVPMEQDVLGAELFHAPRGGLALEKELDAYKKMLKYLHAPIPHTGSFPSMGKYVGDIAKLLVGSIASGVGGLATPAVMRHIHPGQVFYDNAVRMQMVAGGAASLAGLYALYRLYQFGESKKKEFHEADKLREFIAMWPTYRDDAPDYIENLIEPVYAKFAIDGDLNMTPLECCKMYRLVCSLIYIKVHQLADQINETTKAKKLQEKNAKNAQKAGMLI